MSTTIVGPSWPLNVNLPSGQSGMSEEDWIDYIEAALADIDGVGPIDACPAQNCRDPGREIGGRNPHLGNRLNVQPAGADTDRDQITRSGRRQDARRNSQRPRRIHRGVSAEGGRHRTAHRSPVDLAARGRGDLHGG